MSWTRLNTFFEVERPAWGTFANPAPPQAEILPAFATDEEKKKAFGIALAKLGEVNRDNAFKAGLEIFNDQTGPALWVSAHWMADPIAMASRDIYLKSIKAVEKPLDKTELAARLLALADEKVTRNGQAFHVHEAKDRIAALKAYAEVLGYTGKINIDNSTNNNLFQNNVMELVLIPSPEQNVNKLKVVEQIDSDLEPLDVVPIEIKLVS